LGSNAKYYELAKHTLCIDHHASNQAFAEENYIIPDASSTCELVFNMMDTEKVITEVVDKNEMLLDGGDNISVRCNDKTIIVNSDKIDNYSETDRILSGEIDGQLHVKYNPAIFGNIATLEFLADDI
jgi:hypothetical protein